MLKVTFKGKGAGLLSETRHVLFLKKVIFLLVSTFSEDSEPLKSFLDSDFECTVL